MSSSFKPSPLPGIKTVLLRMEDHEQDIQLRHTLAGVQWRLPGGDWSACWLSEEDALANARAFMWRDGA